MKRIDPLLKVQGLTLRFGGLMALQDVELEVTEGEIHGLIGPNGAGKTSLLNIITGIYRPTKGEVTFKGTDLLRLKPYQIAVTGIARTFQRVELFPSMTVLENVMVGRHIHMGAGVLGCGFALKRMRDEEEAAREKALETLKLVGLQRHCYKAACSLPFGLQRLLELGRAVVLKPSLLLLDEPGAGMSHAEVEELKRVLRLLRSDHGITIMLAEHVMHLVMDISERISVLNYGQKIAEGPPEVVQDDPKVIEAYLGMEGTGATLSTGLFGSPF